MANKRNQNRSGTLMGARLVLHLLGNKGVTGGATPQELSALTGSDPSYVRRVCTALEDSRIFASTPFRRQGARTTRVYALHPEWQEKILTTRGTPSPPSATSDGDTAT